MLYGVSFPLENGKSQKCINQDLKTSSKVLLDNFQVCPKLNYMRVIIFCVLATMLPSVKKVAVRSKTLAQICDIGGNIPIRGVLYPDKWR